MNLKAAMNSKMSHNVTVMKMKPSRTTANNELEEFITAQKSTNTVKKNESDIRALKRFAATINEPREPEFLTAKEHDKLLAKFFKDVRKADGGETVRTNLFNKFSTELSTLLC